MQSSTQFPYPFSPMTLASMFDLHNLQNHHQNNPSSNNNNNNNINNNSSPIVGNNSSLSPSTTPDSPRENNLEAAAVAMSHFLFPQSFLNHNFPHHHQGHHQAPYHGGGSNGQLYNPFEQFESSLNNHHKEKLMNTSSTGKRGGGKSFTIDSLLGLNTLTAARAALVNHHQHLNNNSNNNNNCLNLSTNINGVNGVGVNWRHSAEAGSAINLNHNSHKNELVISSKKESRRFHPFSTTNHHVTSKSHKIKTNNSAISNSSEKSQESNAHTNGGRRGSKAKRVRTIFTPEQLERLEAEFERQQYMVGPERLYLASSLHLTEAQVKVWFQNRRIKWRKQHLEMQQQRLAVLRAERLGEIDDDEEDLEEDDQSQSDRSDTPFSPPVLSMPLMINRIKEHQNQQHQQAQINSNQKNPSLIKSSGSTQYNSNYISPCSSTTLSCSPPIQINLQHHHPSSIETSQREKSRQNMNRSGSPGKEKRPIIRFYSNISEENFSE